MQYNLDELQKLYSTCPSDISLGDIDLNNLPKHISFIMDGNGRWATSRGLERAQGHKAGVNSLREIITCCVRLGIDCMSAYAFSTENWKRPKTEVTLLMHLFATTLIHELPLFDEHDVRLVFLGDIDALPEKTKKVFEEGLYHTKDHKGMVLALAVNYGSRNEIARAAREIAKSVLLGELNIEDIDEETISNNLYTASLPDPDLLIRSSGEIRLSNYLLYQIAYSEFYISDKLWPDFDRFELLRAIKSYQSRDRRFGGVKDVK